MCALITCRLLTFIACTDPIIRFNNLASFLIRVLARYLSDVVNDVYVVVDYLGLLVILLVRLLHNDFLNVALVDYLELSAARMLNSFILRRTLLLVHRVVRSSPSLFADCFTWSLGRKLDDPLRYRRYCRRDHPT